MTFNEAMEAAKKPAFVKRDSWNDATVREKRHGDTDEVLGLFIERKRAGKHGIAHEIYRPTQEDWEATDWRLATPKEEPGG